MKYTNDLILSVTPSIIVTFAIMFSQLSEIYQWSCVVNNPVSNTAASSSTRKIRCECCNKKVGLTGFNCLCRKIFWGMHRHVEEHSCMFGEKRKREKESWLSGHKLNITNDIIDVIILSITLSIILSVKIPSHHTICIFKSYCNTLCHSLGIYW